MSQVVANAVMAQPNPMQKIGAYFWGDNGQQLTPQQAAAQQQVANAMIGNAPAPHTIGEGLNAIGRAIVARKMSDSSSAAIEAGTGQATKDLQTVIADPTKASAFLANDAYATDAQKAVAQAYLSQQMMLTNPDMIMQRRFQLSEINKNNAESGLPPMGEDGQPIGSTGGGVGFPGTDAAAAENRLLLNGDPSSPAYAVAYAHQYGPKTISVPGIDGVPVIQTIQQPIPASIRPPTFKSAPVAASAVPDAPVGTAPPASSPTGSPDNPASTTIPTVGGGSVTQTGAQVNRQVYNSNRAMTVAAPALKTLHEKMSVLGDPQNRVALQAGEVGKFIASDEGKQAMDSINAIANTVASAQNIDPKIVREELTPLSTDTPAMLQFRLARADEYVNGLASGDDTAKAKAGVADAIATPSARGQDGVTNLAGATDPVAAYNALPKGAQYLAPGETKPRTKQ